MYFCFSFLLLRSYRFYYCQSLYLENNRTELFSLFSSLKIYNKIRSRLKWEAWLITGSNRHFSNLTTLSICFISPLFSVNPCELHCRPVSQYFSERMFDTVTDGTPCFMNNKSRNICINGVCKVVWLGKRQIETGEGCSEAGWYTAELLKC